MADRVRELSSLPTPDGPEVSTFMTVGDVLVVGLVVGAVVGLVVGAMVGCSVVGNSSEGVKVV